MANLPTERQGVSSIGRVAVSKTVGWGFKSLTPCQSAGGVAEWSIAAVLKTAVGLKPTGGSNPSPSAT